MKTAKPIILSAILSIMIGCGGGGSSTPVSHTEQSETQKDLTTQSLTQKLTYDKDGKISTINASGDVKSVAATKNALFFAEGKSGVEIVKIGYSDKISTEVLYKITDIDAQSVTLSADESTLYVEDEEGFVQIIDIRDLSHPVHKGHLTKQAVNHSATSQNGTYIYIPRGEDGLGIVNVSYPSNHSTESTFNKSNAFDIILVDDDSKALIATGAVGINLLDISNPKNAQIIANYRIKGSKVTGLSLNEAKDLLFVATGDKGVLVFNLDILLHKLGY